MRIARALLVALTCASLLLAPVPAAFADGPPAGGSSSNGSPSTTDDGPSAGGGGGADGDGSIARVTEGEETNNPVCRDSDKSSVYEKTGSPRTIAPSPLCDGYPFASPGGLACPRGTVRGDDRLCKFRTLHRWTEDVANCQVGFEVYTFYGTIENPTQAVTRTRVDVPKWECRGAIQRYRVCFPNALDASASTSEAAAIRRAQAGNVPASECLSGDPKVAGRVTSIIPWDERAVCRSSDQARTPTSCAHVKVSQESCSAVAPERKDTLAGFFAKPEYKASVQDVVYRNYVKVRGELLKSFPRASAEAIARQFSYIPASVGSLDRKEDVTAVGGTPACSSIFQYAPVYADELPELEEGEHGAVGMCVIGLTRPASMSDGGAPDFFYDGVNGNASRTWYGLDTRNLLPPDTGIMPDQGSNSVILRTVNGGSRKATDRRLWAKYLSAAVDARVDGSRHVPYADPDHAPLGSVALGQETGFPSAATLAGLNDVTRAFDIPAWSRGLYPGGLEGRAAIRDTMKAGMLCKTLDLAVELKPALAPEVCKPGTKPDGKGKCVPVPCEATGTCSDPCPDCLPGSPDPDPKDDPDPRGLHLRLTLEAPDQFNVGGELSLQEASIDKVAYMCSTTRECDQSDPGRKWERPSGNPDPVFGSPSLKLYVDSSSPAFKECETSRERQCSYLVKSEGSEVWKGIFFSPTNARQFMQPRAVVKVGYTTRGWRHKPLVPGNECPSKDEDPDCVPKAPEPEYWYPVNTGSGTLTEYAWAPRRPLWKVIGSTGS